MVQYRHTVYHPVKVWQYNDEGDIRGVLTKDISSNMDGSVLI